jgi:hypothetical protein
MAIERTVMDTVPGAVAMVSDSGAITASFAAGEASARRWG